MGAEPAPASLLFHYHRSVAPMLWVFVGLATIELFAVHLLVALIWSGTAALILSLLTLASIVWLLLLIRSFRRRPVLVEPDRIVMRFGTLIRVEIDRDNIAAIRTDWPSGALKAPGLVNLAAIAHPNVIVDLRQPVERGRGRKPVRAVAHRLDDLPSFLAAVPQASGSGGT